MKEIVLPLGVEPCACDEAQHLRCLLEALSVFLSAEAPVMSRELFTMLCENPAAVYEFLAGDVEYA